MEDERIKLFKLKENIGLAGALNYILKIVLKDPDYKLIARMDADDISLSSRFEKQRDFILKNPDISCVGCWYHIINESGKVLSDRKLPVEHEALKKIYYTRAPFAHPSVMYRKDLIEVAGFYPVDTILMEDNVLWGRALKAGIKFENIPEFLFMFRKDNNYYMRRSGLRYGWSYIKTRFILIKSVNLPVYSYLISFLVGIIKMLPLSARLFDREK